MAETEELSEEVKLAIVQALAWGDPPSVVVTAVNDEFGIKITPQRVMKYNPTKVSGAGLGEKLKAIFYETRKQWLEEIAEMAIQHRLVRVRRYMRIADRAAGSAPNPVLEMQALEAIAKEMGEAFTNKHKHEHTGKDGKDLPAAPVVLIYKPTADGAVPQIKGLPPGTIMLPDNGRD